MGRFNKTQHGSQFPPQDLFVGLFGKALKVYVGGIREGQDFRCRLSIDTAVADQNIGNPFPAASGHAVQEIFNVYKWLRIGVCDLGKKTLPG
jgi:hypothetical protein